MKWSLPPRKLNGKKVPDEIWLKAVYVRNADKIAGSDITFEIFQHSVKNQIRGKQARTLRQAVQQVAGSRTFVSPNENWTQILRARIKEEGALREFNAVKASWGSKGSKIVADKTIKLNSHEYIVTLENGHYVKVVYPDNSKDPIMFFAITEEIFQAELKAMVEEHYNGTN